MKRLTDTVWLVLKPVTERSGRLKGMKITGVRQSRPPDGLGVRVTISVPETLFEYAVTIEVESPEAAVHATVHAS